MVAYSRLRFYIDALPRYVASDICSIVQLTYYDGATALVPTGATASSFYSSGSDIRPASNVLTSSTSTFWSCGDLVGPSAPGVANPWIELQYASPVTPTSVELKDRDRIDQTPIYGRLYGSNDGVTYTLIETYKVALGSVTASFQTFNVSLLPKVSSYLFDKGITPGRVAVATTDLVASSGYTIDKLFDGLITDNTAGSWVPATSQTSPKFIKWDFGVGVTKRITELNFLKTFATVSGVWKLQGSNDDVTWVDESATFNYGSPSLNFIVSVGLTSTFYRYYKLVMVSGTTSSSGYQNEIQFKLNGPSGEPSYVSAYGAGGNALDRRETMGFASKGSFSGAAIRNVLQGLAKTSASHWFGAGNTQAEFVFDLEQTGFVCTEITWRQETSSANGSWIVAFSDDGMTYTDYSMTPVAFTGTNVLSMAGNTTPHRFIKVKQVSGSTTSSPYVFNFEFKLGYVGAVTSIDKDLILDWSILAPTDISKDLILDWSIVGPPFNKDLVLNWSIENPSTNYWEVFEGDRITDEHIVLPAIADRSASDMLAPIAGTPGGLVIPSGPPAMTPVVGIIGGYFYSDYYERIWISPTEFKLSNPRLNTPIAFNVWNAYSKPNTLNSYSYIDLIGVEVIPAAPVSFDRYERQELAFQILNNAPIRIDGNVAFNFTFGTGNLHISAIIIEALRASPEIPISETWTWKTVVNIAYNSKEQRRALRMLPRISTGFTIYIQDEADRRYQYKYLSTFISRNVRIPFYQYATQLKAAAVIGGTELFFERSQTFVKDLDYVSIFNPHNEESNLVRLGALTATGAMLALPLDFDIPAYALVVPLVDMRMPEGTGFVMRSIAGELQIEATSVNAQSILRPGSAVTLTTFDGLPVLDKRPLADDDVPELFVTGVEVFDNDIAPAEYYTKWPVPFINGERVFKAVRVVDMDYWRTLATTLNGMQNPFLLPTFRDDLPILGVVALGASVIRTSNVDYAEYFLNDTYKRIQLQTANGVVYRKVVSVTLDDDGGLSINLETALGTNPGDNIIGYVSYLNKVRLDSDTVDLQHTSSIDTFIKISVRTIDA